MSMFIEGVFVIYRKYVSSSLIFTISAVGIFCDLTVGAIYNVYK